MASETEPTPLADVWFLDVGQGDCTVAIDRRTRLAVAVDCPAGRVDRLLDLLRQEDATLHTAVVTHWDLDHYGGISRAARALRPDRLWYNHDTLFPPNDRTGKYVRTTLRHFLDLVPFGVVLEGYRDGVTTTIGSIRLDFLAPTHVEVTTAITRRERNVASAVAALSIGPLRILIGGDAVAATWTRLLESGRNLHADVLRWPHHGAKLAGDTDGSVQERLVKAISPGHLIISAGTANRYGHPADAVIVNAASSGIGIRCTQITPKCLDAHSTDTRPAVPGQRHAPAVESMPCAGDVKISVAHDLIEVSPDAHTHQRKISQWGERLCRAPSRRMP